MRTKPKRPKHKNYPWKDWIARVRPIRFRRGREYDCRDMIFAQQCRNAAVRYGVRASVDWGVGYVVAHFYEGDGK